jgi:putative transposase
MENYRTGAPTVSDIQYHWVWVTKYRYHVLEGEVAERRRDIIRQICMSRDMHILKGQVSKDPIHVRVSCPPSFCPAKVVQYLKGSSSRRLQEEFPHLKKRYWGQHIWPVATFVPAWVG